MTTGPHLVSIRLMQPDVNFKPFSLIEFVSGHRCEGMRPLSSKQQLATNSLTSINCTLQSRNAGQSTGCSLASELRLLCRAVSGDPVPVMDVSSRPSSSPIVIIILTGRLDIVDTAIPELF